MIHIRIIKKGMMNVKKINVLLLSCVTAVGVMQTAVYADNPIVQTRFTADPAPMVSADGETLYLFTSHDEPEGGENGGMYVMNDWNLYSTQDMVNYTDLGVAAGYDVFEWSKGDAWAIQTVRGLDGRFYLYAPVAGQSSTAIGVAVADRIEGPYKDALGKPLTEKANFIDPSVYVDHESGRAFIVWGNPDPYFAELNPDMVSFKTQPVKINKTYDAFGIADEGTDRVTRYEEGPWIYKRGDMWYLVYAGNGIPEDLEYSVCDNDTFLEWISGLSAADGTEDYAAVDGPWKYKGVLMETFSSGTFTNHPGPVDFKGNSYLFYHTAQLPGANGFRRSVAVDAMKYGQDGSIEAVIPTSEGPTALKDLNPYTRVEAETIAFSEGLETDEYYTNTETGEISDTFMDEDTKNVFVTGIENDDYIKVANVDFGNGAGIFTACVASAKAGGEIELHIDSADGAVVGTLPISYTGGEDVWQEKKTAITGAEGVHDLYLVFKGEERVEDLFDFDYWRFTEKSDEAVLTALNVSIDEYKIDTREGANTANMKVTAIYSDGSSKDVTSEVSVVSENVSYDNGVLIGKTYGDAVIDVSYGGVSEQVKIQIKDMETEEKVSDLSIAPESVKLVYGGIPTQITVTAVYEDGHTEDVTAKAEYAAADTSVVTVEKGNITPEKVGRTNVTVSYGGRLGEVKNAVLPIEVASNMILNGDFESGSTEPWVNYFSTISVEKEDGNNILKVTDRVSDEEWEQGTANGAHYTLGAELPTGKTYKFSARLKYTDGPDTREFSMVFWNGWEKFFENTSWGDEYGGYTLQTVTAEKGKWTTFSGTVTIPEGAYLDDEFALGFITTWVEEASAENDLMDYYIDDVTFADVDAEEPYEQISTVSEAERIGGNIVLTTTASNLITDKILHIALYNKNGEMVKYMQIPTSSSEKTAYVVFDDNVSAEYAKVFIWDSIGQMNPGSSAETVKIQ